MKVCLDTNVLVAAFATRGLCADVLRTVLAEHELVIGEVILAELRRVLTRKFKVPADQLSAVDAVFASFTIIPKPPKPAAPTLRDADDQWVIATALAGEADLLVTGDRDIPDTPAHLLPVRALEPRAFWELLRGSESQS